MMYVRFKEDGSKVILEKSQVKQFEAMGYTFTVCPVVKKEEVVVDDINTVTEVTEEVAEVVKETTKKGRKKKTETVEETPAEEVAEVVAEETTSEPDIIL